MTITRDEAIAALRPLLPVIEQRHERVRIVGTASSLLRGVDVPAGDVDILARTRDVVDELARDLDEAGATREAAPRWIDAPFGGQYIADSRVGDVLVQISTVELSEPDPSSLAECAGDAAWRYFDVVDVDGYVIPVVASELRLLSDVIRGRPERWRPVAARLARDGYDEALLETAMSRLPPERAAEVRAALRVTA
jgi:hypothetical protein